MRCRKGRTALRRCATSRARVLLIWFSAIAVVALALVGVTLMMSKPPARYMCPPNCGRPPTGTPVETNPRFIAPDGAFSVSYPAEGSAYKITTKPNGVTADLQAGDGGTLQLFSEPAANRSPEQIAKSLISRTFPDARTAYKIPNAMVGYQPGYGEAADCWPQGANSSYMKMRVMVMVAVKNDLALGRGGGRPVPSVRPGVRQRQAVRSKSPNRFGHGQIRQQLLLARRPAAGDQATSVNP